MKIYTVDSFTDKPFSGNPAGVCLLDKAISDEQCQLIAREINYAETAFVIPEGKGFNLRWFTPTVEVDLCGHATLAAAKIIFKNTDFDEPEVRFFTRSGILTVKLIGDLLEMDFPAKPSEVSDSDEIMERFIGQKPLSVAICGDWTILEVASSAWIRLWKPNPSILREHQQVLVIVTARDDNYDFVSRCFAPNAGIDEDPVTGGAHCMLTPFWSKKLSATTFQAFQASQRGGSIECTLAENNRVLLRGHAVIMGELLVDWF